MARFLEPLLYKQSKIGTANMGSIGALSAAHPSAWGPEVPVLLEVKTSQSGTTSQGSSAWPRYGRNNTF
jgi:hypothetical protein